MRAVSLAGCPGCYINVYALWRAIHDASATERPAKTLCEEKVTSSRFEVRLLS